MDEAEFQVLSPKPVGYEEALRRAWDALSGADAAELAARKGVEVRSDGAIELPFLAEVYRVDLKGRRVLDAAGGEVYPFLRVLLLHYLCGDSGAEPTGEWLGFRQLRGGETYFPAFAARTSRRLAAVFGGRERLLYEAAEALDGRKLAFGDASCAFDVFPRASMAVVLHASCEDFGAEAAVLFDSAAPKHLETEDLAVCGAFLTSRLCKPYEDK